MTNQPVENDIQKAWQSQPTESLAMSLREIRNRAGKFERRIKHRNLRESIAAAVVVAAFGWLALVFENTIARAGCVLVILGTFYMVRQLYRRGSVARLPQEAGLLTSIEHYREELIRQRDLLRGIWSWYIGPFLPGSALLYIAGLVSRPDKVGDLGLNALLFGSMLLIVWGINWRAAKKLQQQIEELDRLTNGELS